ncbi:conserved hypothetical protein [Glutamicibacter arilaitensis Re117]|uniref:Uncharacterized protein n=1 Tax=Glutamicibacter arilaitensis (strain DSM 16368 / CIP 108037 / IAM 15318 / JCM 13566 / NCIMB 14258 / Re117) TaxID=861360 RepID=A0ABM9Q0Q0_GLUAR|nr:hypothetical protein [Glutamicibacter arilaitensis]CBT77231.1 conserved hypothetical protein [Glutamicibacter arilaitensis Re117]
MSEEHVDVRFTAAGAPWKIRRSGRVWQVVVEPTVHFERVKWWEDTSFSIKKGKADRIDYAVWLVQVRLGNNPNSDILTWHLIEHPRTDSWSVQEVL